MTEPTAVNTPSAIKTPAANDDFDDVVEGIIDVLPSGLEGAWLVGLDDEPGLEEHEILLRVAFWDAARAAIAAMLCAGYTITPPSK